MTSNGVTTLVKFPMIASQILKKTWNKWEVPGFMIIILFMLIRNRRRRYYPKARHRIPPGHIVGKALACQKSVLFKGCKLALAFSWVEETILVYAAAYYRKGVDGVTYAPSKVGIGIAFKISNPVDPQCLKNGLEFKKPEPRKPDFKTGGLTSLGSIVFFSRRPVSELNSAATTIQNVYKSYRTRRNVAVCAAVVEELWWKALDFASLEHSLVSFFNVQKPEIATSLWAKARTRAAKVGKGLSKNEKALKLALQHWLEAIDPRHHYGHNLNIYYDLWFGSESSQPFFYVYWYISVSVQLSSQRLDVGDGKEKNLERCPRVRLQQQCIKYLAPKEVNFSGNLKHPNIVKLVGYCWEDREFLLVYEFMQKGRLENHLFKKDLQCETDVSSMVGIGIIVAVNFPYSAQGLKEWQWEKSEMMVIAMHNLLIISQVEEIWEEDGENQPKQKVVQEKKHAMIKNQFNTVLLLVGIDSRVDAFQSLLDIEAKDKVRMVGINGAGEIGKTTLARALFRRISYNFAGSSFVKDVRECSCSERDICALQEKVLREILMANHKFCVEGSGDGADMIWARFIHKNILLVLDDVDNGKQLEFLAATHHWFGPESRIIITTRNEQLLSDTNARYKPSFLSEDDALELFSRHTFMKKSPPEGYEELSFRAISCAGYLPLALKVLGSFFRGRKADVWGSASNRQAKTPNDEIFKSLKLSFDSLEDSEPLDIANFFKGHGTRILVWIGIYIAVACAMKEVVPCKVKDMGLESWISVEEVVPCKVKRGRRSKKKVKEGQSKPVLFDGIRHTSVVEEMGEVRRLEKTGKVKGGKPKSAFFGGIRQVKGGQSKSVLFDGISFSSGLKFPTQVLLFFVKTMVYSNGVTHSNGFLIMSLLGLILLAAPKCMATAGSWSGYPDDKGLISLAAPQSMATAGSWSGDPDDKGLISQMLRMWNEWALCGLILISLISQIALSLLGYIRKYNWRTPVRMGLWFACLLAYSVVPAALGMIIKTYSEPKPSVGQLHRLNKSELMSFWAPFLFLHLGGPDSITAFALEDSELYLRYFVEMVFLSVVALYILLQSWPGYSYLPQLSILVYLAGFVKCYERIQALRLANTRYLSKSMLSHPDPGPNSCKQDLHPKKSQRSTVSDTKHEPRSEMVFQSVVAYVVQTLFQTGNKGSGTVISDAYGLFQTFKRLFEDLVLTFEDRDGSQSYFHHLKSDDAFHIVEIELGFAFDMLYTKANVVYTFMGLMLRLTSFFFLLMVLVCFYILYDMDYYPSIDIVITYLLVGLAIFMEMFSIITMLRSDWTDHWLSQRNLTRNILVFPFLKQPTKQRWSGSIGQFDLLSVAIEEKPATCLKIQKFFGINFTCVKHRYKTYSKVSDNLKRLIYNHFRELMVFNFPPKELCSHKGSFSLRKNECDSLLWSTTNVEFDRSILIWHIATTLCYDTELDNQDDGDIYARRTESKHISDYLLYLLVSYPLMLPVVIGMVRYHDTSAEAMRFFKAKGPKTAKVEACRKLLQVEDAIPCKVKGGQSKSALYDGRRLALALKEMGRERMWKVISQVWIEILGYAATHCKGFHHKQHLGKGGEFLTHVWLLMAHLGITEQFQEFQGHSRAKINV